MLNGYWYMETKQSNNVGCACMHESEWPGLRQQQQQQQMDLEVKAYSQDVILARD